MTPESIIQNATVICDAKSVEDAIHDLANNITHDLSKACPIVMSVMGGAVFFSGQLLPLLNFPLEFDYVQATRYHNKTEGQELLWKVEPSENVKGRTVLLLDDILDQGITLQAIRDKCLALGATRVLIAVLVEKQLQQSKPIKADYIGLQVPNAYVFGCGMDAYGWWRNLPAIYALQNDA